MRFAGYCGLRGTRSSGTKIYFVPHTDVPVPEIGYLKSVYLKAAWGGGWAKIELPD